MVRLNDEEYNSLKGAFSIGIALQQCSREKGFTASEWKSVLNKFLKDEESCGKTSGNALYDRLMHYISPMVSANNEYFFIVEAEVEKWC